MVGRNLGEVPRLMPQLSPSNSEGNIGEKRLCLGCSCLYVKDAVTKQFRRINCQYYERARPNNDVGLDSAVSLPSSEQLQPITLDFASFCGNSSDG